MIKVTDTSSMSFKLKMMWRRLWCRHKDVALVQDYSGPLYDAYWECRHCRSRRDGLFGKWVAP